jgi:hypothetical protein
LTSILASSLAVASPLISFRVASILAWLVLICFHQVFISSNQTSILPKFNLICPIRSSSSAQSTTTSQTSCHDPWVTIGCFCLETQFIEHLRTWLQITTTLSVNYTLQKSL